MTGERYTLVVNNEEKSVVLSPDGENFYDVFVDDLLMGRMFKIKQGSFRCRHIESGSVFAGRTRNNAATAMVYWVHKRQS